MLPAIWAAQEKALATVSGILVNGGVVFTVTGGPIQILEMGSVCTVTNSGTGTTIQYSSSPTVGTASTFSGASGSLTSCAPGAMVLLTPTALTTALTIILHSAGGVALGLAAQNHIIVQAGTITTTCATILATAKWYHFIRYKPLTADSLVS